MESTKKAKDYANDQDVRWCPGCGDYSILIQFQSAMADLNIPNEQIAIISGIGCSSRFPYYMNTYGVHSIHGRATAFATGLRIARPDLDIWVITGDGDGLSIGGNHMLHVLRRNLNIKILLFNNEIYGLTKGQYSPTSNQGLLTKSSPNGSLDFPLNPLAFALTSGATFVARSLDRDPNHLREMIKESYGHKGVTFLDIYQNCNIFNDGIYHLFSDKLTKENNTLFLKNNQPLVFGTDLQFGILLDGYTPKRVSLIEDKYTLDDLWVHDESDPYKAHILTHFFEHPKDMTIDSLPRPFGIFFRQQKDCYEDLLHKKIKDARGLNKRDLKKLLHGNSTWEVN